MKRKTHCKRGHEYTPENTRLQRSGRSCISCDLIRQRLKYRHDDAFRERAKAYSKAARARNKAALKQAADGVAAAAGASAELAVRVICRRRLVPL